MKREILFRGFNECGNGTQIAVVNGKEYRGEWVEGCYVYDNNLNHHIRAFDNCYYAVIPETVGQWTGLKDKNGNKIYEGDIVTGLFNYTDIIGHIVYGSDATFFIERKGLYGIGLNNAEDWLEVIGNIHEEVTK